MKFYKTELKAAWVFCLIALMQSAYCSTSASVTGLVLVKESENLPVICIPFKSVLTSPTHVFIETESGESQQFFRRSVLHVFRLTLPSPADSPNFTTASHLAPVRTYLNEINRIAEVAPCAQNFFQPLVSSLRQTIEKFENGERRFNGRWMSSSEYEAKFLNDSGKSEGNVELRLKNGSTLRWPRVQIQGERLVYLSDIGVQAVHRDELVDDQKYIYFPDTRQPEEVKSEKVSDVLFIQNTQTETNPQKITPLAAPLDAKKFTEGTTRFFRLKDGTTHIGRIIISDEETLMIFTTAAKTYRIRREDIVVGLDEELLGAAQ